MTRSGTGLAQVEYIYVCVIWEGEFLTLIVIFSIVSSLRKGDSWMDKSDKGVKWKNGYGTFQARKGS